MPTPNEFSNYQFRPNGNIAGGDASPTADAPTAPQSVYPDVVGYGFEESNKQCSGDKEGDPQRLADVTESSMGVFAELQQFLMTDLRTPGTRTAHPVETAPTSAPASLWQPQSGAEGDESIWP